MTWSDCFATQDRLTAQTARRMRATSKRLQLEVCRELHVCLSSVIQRPAVSDVWCLVC